jgi:hypothetical protein
MNTSNITKIRRISNNAILLTSVTPLWPSSSTFHLAKCVTLQFHYSETIPKLKYVNFFPFVVRFGLSTGFICLLQKSYTIPVSGATATHRSPQIRSSPLRLLAGLASTAPVLRIVTLKQLAVIVCRYQRS